MGNPNPSPTTRFPVNRPTAPHTQKGPYLTPILKRLLKSEWEFNDPKVKELLKRSKCKETIETAICLRRILNGTEGDDLAIERIFNRIDGMIPQSPLVDQSQHTVIQFVNYGEPIDNKNTSRILQTA